MYVEVEGKRIELTDAQRNTIWNALYVAAQRFDEDAQVCREDSQPGLAEQFEKQARDSRELSALFEA
jgi:hypothetical protein